jgi:tetratricopeptide (TPR) repeat protein
LSSPTLREQSLRESPPPPDTVPMPGALDATIWCRGKTQHQIIAEVARAMRGSAATPDSLLALAKMRSEPLVIAVDALDEAVGGEAERIASDVLAAVARDSPVRFLVATRRHPVGGGNRNLLAQLGVDEREIIDLDVAQNRQEDMTSYVASRLSARGFATGEGDEGTKLAGTIAEAAGKSFLVASIAARIAVPGEEDKFQLPTEVGEALAAYLDRLPDPEYARDVLRPLAWAQGPGLPWGKIWPMLAERLKTGSTAPIDDAAIAATLDAAGDLVVESDDAGEPVYRLFHEALAEHFRAAMPSLQVADDLVAHGLLDIKEDRLWEDVPRYVRTYLPAYLTRAGLADELIAVLLDPTWIRQRRLDTGDSLAVLRDVDAACAKFRKLGRSSDVAQLSYQYSQLMTRALPPLISILARAGQRVRADAMAGNLEDIADRMITYRSLATIHGRNGDAARYALEVLRGVPAMHADHRPMAWCWAAEAFIAVGQREQASHAVSEALAAVAANDEWDQQNGLFWAAMAARASGDDAARKAVAERIDLLFGESAIFRNQILQAAAVAGCADFLKAKFAQFMALDPEAHSPIRVGNLGLALADAGLDEEMAQLIARVGATRPPGEPDSLKRWAWALAHTGRLEAAVDALAYIDDPIERSKALARIAGFIGPSSKMDLIERLAQLIDAESPEIGSRTEARLILAYWTLGKREDALRRAERAIAADARPGIMLDPRADSSAEPLGTPDERGAKTARRAMISSRAPASDEASCTAAQASAEAGDFAAARSIAAKIEIPRYRAQAFNAIVSKDSDERSAEDAWMEALIAALRVGRALVEDTVAIMLERWKRADRWDECVALTKSLHGVDFTWQREFFSDEYLAVRTAFEPGPTRTLVLDRLMLAPIALGGNLLVNDDEDLRKEKVRETWERDSDGDRLFALGIMIGNMNLALADLIVDGIRNSRSAFEQYYALRAAYNAVTPPGAVPMSWMRLTGPEKAAIVQAINDELAQLPRADGSPAWLQARGNRGRIAKRILAQLVDGVEERRTWGEWSDDRL